MIKHHHICPRPTPNHIHLASVHFQKLPDATAVSNKSLIISHSFVHYISSHRLQLPLGACAWIGDGTTSKPGWAWTITDPNLPDPALPPLLLLVILSLLSCRELFFRPNGKLGIFDERLNPLVLVLPALDASFPSSRKSSTKHAGNRPHLPLLVWPEKHQ